MKILYVNGKFLSQPVTGVQRFAAGVLDSWDADLREGLIDASKYSIQVIAPKTERAFPAYQKISIVPSFSGGRLWEQVELPFRSRGSVLFSPYAAAPLIKARHVVTIHDAGMAATPEQYNFTFRKFYSGAYRWFGQFAAAITTVSEFSKLELHRYFSIPLDKMTVIAPGADHLMKVPAERAVLNRFSLTPGQFVLGVSSRSPIKNFDGLARAWNMIKRPGMKLAIAGMQNSQVFRTQTSMSEEEVSWLGYVSDGELRSLYENAALFAYPSLYEGFGYPPVEAMSCGCPVVVSGSSALPETCGKAALYCDPHCVEDIAEKIVSVLDNPALAQELRDLGRQRAAEFSPRANSRKIWQKIQEYLG